MKVIDFHTHIFPDHLAARAMATLTEHAPSVAPCSDGTLGGLKKSMQQNQVTQSVLLPIATKPAQVRTINQLCPGLVSLETIPFGTLHPAMENVEDEVLYLKSLNVKGIKLHPEYQDFYIDAPNILPIYEMLAATGFIVVFHAGKDPGPFTCDHALPPAFKKIHQNFPDLKMVVTHMGGWQVWEAVEQNIINLPIFFDTAAVREFMPEQEFKRLAGLHGTEWILFGTDSPWYDQGRDREWIETMDFTSNEKERIFYKNAQELLQG
jgi:uncharacterized protein